MADDKYDSLTFDLRETRRQRYDASREEISG